MKYYKNQWLNLTINAFDSLQIQCVGELTGTYVLADQPISLFSGNKLSAIPGSGTGDHLVEQQIPLDNWGKTFATVPIPGRTVGDKFRFLASESRTTVQVNGHDNGMSLSYSFVLDTFGDWVEKNFSSDMYALIKSNKPILVVQYSVSQVDSSRPSDPSMIIVPPIELYSANYVFTTPKMASLSSYKNYFMFVIKRVNKDGLRINGKNLTTVLHTFPDGEYVGGSLYIPEGVYDIRHTSPICVFMGILYGTGTYDSYGFPVGMRMASINSVCNITNTIPSDGIDNDCDGKIDEELYNNKDDDGDGLIDEDIAGFYTDNPCYATPCFNGGNCTDSGGNYTCTCMAEYDPLTDCKTKLDACVSLPCIHGNCINYFTNYTCSCYVGYTGVHCQTDINECASSPRINGYCRDLVNGYKCSCNPGYTGTFCETDIDECASSPCIYGNCTDLVNGFTCTYNPKNIGSMCETEKWNIPNPCTRENLANGTTKFPHPKDHTKYLMCDNRGELYIVQCPQFEFYHPSCQQCIGNKSSCPTDNKTPIPTTVANPCTLAHLQAGQFFFIYPLDVTKFIHCDVWGKAWVLNCPDGEKWDQAQLTCVLTGLIVNPCKNVGPTGPFFYEYPCDHRKYIRCDDHHQMFIQYCQLHQVYNPTTQVCVPRNSYVPRDPAPGTVCPDGSIVGSSGSTHVVTDAPSHGGGDDIHGYICCSTCRRFTAPCNHENIAKGVLLHPIAGDRHHYIQCDLTGNMYCPMSCNPEADGSLDYFNIRTQTCVDGSLTGTFG